MTHSTARQISRRHRTPSRREYQRNTEQRAAETAERRHDRAAARYFFGPHA